MKKILFVSLVIVMGLVSCGASRHTSTVYTPPTIDINLALQATPTPNQFVGLEYGIRLSVKDQRANPSVVLHKHDGFVTSKPITNVYPDVYSFVSESTRRYMRTLGFNLDADPSTDYLMTVTLTDFNVSWLSGVGWSATVHMNVQVADHNRTMVYPSVVVTGRSTQSASGGSYSVASMVLNKAFENALNDIDWDRIAFFLDKAERAALEGNKQVAGEGNTALESTVIRWNVVSAPQGADVYWRVISSTPDVKNTNSNYLGTTPYESTETFDIVGLTYNNSGNVQIEITCEKPGYLSQKKRFNLRQVIDQKEISTKFNLVKEE